MWKKTEFNQRSLSICMMFDEKNWYEYYNPQMHFVLYVRRSAKILILNKEGIIEKISYERSAYESVDEKSLS